MTLEAQLLAFATSEVNRLKDGWYYAQMSDDFAYTNGTKAAYDLAIAMWEGIATFIAKKYGLEVPYATKPASTTALSGYLSAHIASCSDQLEFLASKLDEANSAQESANIDHRFQSHRREIARHKRLANFYAHLLSIQAPYPGVDMLPAEISAAA